MSKIMVDMHQFMEADDKTKVRYLKNDIKRIKRALRKTVNLTNRELLMELIFNSIWLIGYHKRLI